MPPPEAPEEPPALQIPELIGMIIDHIEDPSSIVASAQISSRWHRQALRRLWREVKNPSRLFAFLEPLGNHGPWV